MSKRDKLKYPALNPNYNLKSRQDLIDFDYLDDLSEDNLEYLNNFVAETVNTNFLHDAELKRLNNIKSEIVKCPIVMDLLERVKAYKIDLSEASDADEKRSIQNLIDSTKKEITALKKANKVEYRPFLADIDKQIQARREEVLLYPKGKQHRAFYTENNIRNNDLYNTMKRTGNMFQLEPDVFESYYINSRKNVDYEAMKVDKLSCIELEEKEYEVYTRLKEMDCQKSKEYIKALDKCQNHDDLYFLLIEIENTIEL